jgi:uncharacterized membrane protein
MSGLTVFLMGTQRFSEMQPFTGMRFALGGGLLLSMGLFLVGVAMLTLNILVFIKVIKMEKMMRNKAKETHTE